MTVPANTSPVERYIGNDTASMFNFDFRITSEYNLKVSVTGKIIADWLTATAYTLGNVVRESGRIYQALTAHTSGVFATDLSNGEWKEISASEAGEVTTVLTYSTDYAINYVSFPRTGGTISLTGVKTWLDGSGNLATGYTLTIEYAPILSQERKFRDYGPSAPIEIEKMQDQTVMALLSIDEKVSRSLKIPRGQGVTSVELPDFLTNENRVLAVSPTADGFIYGPTMDTIAAATGFAAAAAVSAADALLSEQASAASELSSSISEQNTTFYANLFLFEDFIQVAFADSPVGPVQQGALYLADDTLGSIDFNLPSLASVDENWKAAVIKQSASVNVLNVIPDGTDTILGISTFTSDQKGIGCVFFKDSPTNWSIRYFAFTESTGLNPLPMGGAAGAALVKASAADSDVVWEDFVFSGFSSRYNTNINLAGLKNALDFIFGISYLGPLIAGFSGSSNSLREKGATVSGITLTVNVTKRSNDIARIVFKQSGTTFEDLNPPGNVGSGNTNSSIAVTPFSNNMTFQVEVTDVVVGADGGNTVTSSTTYSFVYPYYYGAGASGKTPSQVAALNKLVMNESTNYTRSYTMNNGDVFYFAYPAAYGNLVSILDENGFETFSSWTKTTSNITGLDASAVSYNIYEYNNPVVAGTTFFTFKQ